MTPPEIRRQRSEVRNRIFLLLVMLLIMIDQRAQAQTITLKTGQKVETQRVRRDGEMVMGTVQVGTGSGEVGYHASQIARIEFPEPRGLKNASELLAQRQPDKALAEIEPVVVFYAPFKDLPGAWWTQAALIKMSALAALQRDAEADALAAEIQKAATDPEAALAIQVRLSSGLIRKKDYAKAIAICDAALKQSSNPEVMADAWVHKGDALFAEKQWEAALLAYLHVPVFYSDQKPSIPAALLGSARAYTRLDDAARAKRSLNDLIATYPKSAEAAVAQTELQKMQAP